MLGTHLARLWAQAWSEAKSDIGTDEARGLFVARAHPERLTARRAVMIVSRARLAAGVLAVLTPLWIAIDVRSLPAETWHVLAPMRLLTAAAFAAALVLTRRMHTLRDAYLALFTLYAIPTAFFLWCSAWALARGAGALEGFLTGYAYLPLLMLGALALFPLTLAESAAIAVPTLIMQGATLAAGWPALDWSALAAAFWGLALLAAMAMLAGCSQLASLVVNVREGIHDGLTGCYARRCGEELLDLQYALTSRSGTDLALVLVALDGMEDINERFGRAVGDATLKKVAEVLHDGMRAGDLLVRWAGDQFLLVLPDAGLAQAEGALQRLLVRGLGVRPDRAPVTASIGLAERQRDAADDWWRLVDLVDARMRSARAGGGNRSVAA